MMTEGWQPAKPERKPTDTRTALLQSSVNIPQQAGNVWFAAPEPDEYSLITMPELVLIWLTIFCLWVLSVFAAGYVWVRWLT